MHIYNTSECYCDSSDYWDTVDMNLSVSPCFNASELDGLNIRKWRYSCCIYGRPYNIERERDLVSNTQYIDCNDYTYYDHEEWREFVKRNNNFSDDNLF